MDCKFCVMLVFAMAFAALASASDGWNNYKGYQRPHPYEPTPHHFHVIKYWSVWGDYGACSVTCGWGEQRRYRTCLSETENGYGNSVYHCQGPNYNGRRCYAGRPFDGGWSHWSEWTIVHGYQKMRTRECNYPSPSCGGRPCYGSSAETKTFPYPPTTDKPPTHYLLEKPSSHYSTPSHHHRVPTSSYPAPPPPYRQPPPPYRLPHSPYRQPVLHYRSPALHYRAPVPSYPVPAPKN